MQQSQSITCQKREFPRDYQTPQLYSVYERLYSLTSSKPAKHNSSEVSE